MTHAARGAVDAGAEIGVAILAKAPVPGYAKTRLIPRLGAAGAAALQQHFIVAAVRTARAAALGPVTLWCAPDQTHPAFRAAAEEGVALADQAGADLGARMLAAFQAAERPLLVIGTDCPALTPEHLLGCAARLRAGEDAVLLPAEDGGYVLVGLRRAVPSLFGAMPWGGATVMEETRLRLAAAGLAWSEPETLWDVDTPGDLDRAYAAGLVPATLLQAVGVTST